MQHVTTKITPTHHTPSSHTIIITGRASHGCLEVARDSSMGALFMVFYLKIRWGTDVCHQESLSRLKHSQTIASLGKFQGGQQTLQSADCGKKVEAISRCLSVLSQTFLQTEITLITNDQPEEEKVDVIQIFSLTVASGGHVSTGGWYNHQQLVCRTLAWSATEAITFNWGYSLSFVSLTRYNAQ